MRTWLAIAVELVGGRGERLWPRPGRTFLASRTHSFGDLAVAINRDFARWDLAQLNLFELPDGTRISGYESEYEDEPAMLDMLKINLSRLRLNEKFAFTFDLGDDWDHLCTVGSQRVDPEEHLGPAAIFGPLPSTPIAIWGWGSMPDQYGRRWSGDDGESPIPPDPGGRDLPRLLSNWADRRDVPPWMN